MEKINIKINNVSYQVDKDITILTACRQAGVRVPTLCYLKALNSLGACRMCVVEVVGARNLVAACVYPVNEGMQIITNSKRVLSSRKMTLELMLSNHNSNCVSCVRSGKCELQQLSNELGCDGDKFKGEKQHFEEDVTECIVRDNSKCILCRRCTAACKMLQSVNVIGPNDRGFNTNIGCAFDGSMKDNGCVGCGQCIVVCPTGALREKDDIDRVINVLADKTKHVVVATAPSVRVAVGEEFDYPIGTYVEGKMVTALKMLGFHKVFDVDFAADVTIMEEGTELLGRLTNGGVLPMITSCSPGWINYIEQYHPEQIPNLSSTKSPQQIYGALTKTYYAQKNNIDPKNIVTVSIMPCVAKKIEAKRDNQSAAGQGIQDIDIVLTTRELARLIKRSGIMFRELEDSQFDQFSGTTAGLIFGATGGVMEAALRTVKELVDGKELEKIDFNGVRGTDIIKRATVSVGGKDVKVVVAHGLANANKIMQEIKSGKADYQFVEIMCCPGGCVTGGGQPIVPADILNGNINVKAERAKAMYNADEKSVSRKSHKNPEVIELYDTFLTKPNSHLAHELLHTKYFDRKK